MPSPTMFPAALRRVTRSASHPTYQAMLEVGRAQRTIFVARYLRSRELQHEITEGLNVVEAFNRANSVIYYGKGGEIASNRKEEQPHQEPVSGSPAGTVKARLRGRHVGQAPAIDVRSSPIP